MIGIFDSGVGGMTVAKAVEQLLPHYPLLYLGDIARTPYGPKSAKTIEEYSIQNTRFLIENGATVIVIACNSASSVAIERLRKEYNIPIFEVITPAVEEAVRCSKTGRIGVIGTRATITSGLYEQLITSKLESAKVISCACPLLVPLVEEGWLDKRETKMILRRYLNYFTNYQIDTLVLGCTHYPLLSHLIQHRIGKSVQLIDSSKATAKNLCNNLGSIKSLAQNPAHTVVKNKYYVTDRTPTAQRVANTIFERSIDLLQA